MRALHAFIVRVAAVAATLVLFACQPSRSAEDVANGWPPKLEDEAFWRMVRAFSEAGADYQPVGGYRSDNLVSNERSLQQVMPMLASLRQAGAYIGVGPEQNFTYVLAQLTVAHGSNVEPYLRNETRAQFVRNVAALPRLRLLGRTRVCERTRPWPR